MVAIQICGIGYNYYARPGIKVVNGKVEIVQCSINKQNK